MASKLPTIADLKNFAVNQPGVYEVTRQTLYDFTTYAALGQSSLNFFQLPQGQGGKTKADTNMEAAGALPSPKHFIISSIEVQFFPGVSPGTLQTNLAASQFANDVYAVAKSGYLDLFVGSTSFLTEAPIGRFPPKTKLEVEAAYSIFRQQAVAADAEDALVMDYAAMCGRPYYIDPELTLIPTQNFNVTLNWPAPVPLPSGVAGRIGIVLDGLLYRLAQ